MKAIPNGVDHVSHPNVSRRDSYTKDISSKPAKFPSYMGSGPNMDLSGDATNCIEQKIHKTRAESPNARLHSRNRG